MGPLKSKYGKLQQGQAFASLDMADAFYVKGELPKIHDNMGVMMAKVPQEQRRGAIDLGACHGLLSIRAGQMGWSPVIGMEIDQASVDLFTADLKGKAPAGVRLEQRKIDSRNEDLLSWMGPLVAQGVDTILARRILSELFATTYEKEGGFDDPAIWRDAGLKFGNAAAQAGFRRIIVEGRLWKGRKVLTNPVYKVELEVEALGPAWRQVDRFKEVIMLERA